MSTFPPVVDTAHSIFLAVFPDGTKVSVADHDSNVCLKVTLSGTIVLHIGDNPSESLFSGDSDGQRANHSAAGHSYLNTVEKAMVIANIGLANHADCLDPGTL
eukprot:5800182-Ditylum_brightwellii.AAC.1